MKNLDATALSNDVSNTLQPVRHTGASRAPLGMLLLGVALSTGCGEPGTALQARPADAKGQGLTSLAATCQEIRTADPTAIDGEYTLYVGGDAKKPWTAWCHDMAGTPREYLSLPSGTNYSQYTAGGYATGTSVRTDYAKVRIDPVTLRVSVADQTFAQSTGSLDHGGTLVTSMPYGVAMSCDSTASGMASIDLSGTPFAVAPNDFSLGGNSPAGTTTSSADGRVVSLTGGGYCGWNSWAPAYNPFNQTGGDPLHLEYRDAPVCKGQTAPGAHWQQYTYDSLSLDVDTSSCGFSETPLYFASIGGTGYHWQTTGATSIISPTATGFRVIVRSPSSVTPAFASQFGWHLNWEAMPNSVRQPSLCTGQTAPGATSWQQYGSDGLYLDVDTTACGYSAAPLYFTSLGGLDNHWKTTGATSIYLPTATGFRVYVWYRGNSLTPALANQLGWYLNWRAQPDGLRQSWNCTGRTTQGSTNWQQYLSDTLYVDVSTSGCAATGEPVTSIGGTSEQWGLMGATSIYSPTPTGFRIYVRYPGSNLTPSLANERGWHLNWNRR
ncbi:GON domain-containing protein [Archangium lipolyticum]|uniref:GON domain-containing protein n=1 Tax=Archangium lipolyticum TaxID=2970465 RepID=UPI002149C7BD|nr:GON domain-containing protein [Archangium lipolyticum]